LNALRGGRRASVTLAILVGMWGSGVAQTSDSVKHLPDWSGWWYLDLPPKDTPALYFAKAPFTAQAGAKLKDAEAKANVAALKAAECLPPRFFGLSGGFEEDIEFLFTPGRVTLTNESGLIRRIFTDPRYTPDEIERSDAGLSSGHWEGDTLVVETHSLNPSTHFGANLPSMPRIGNNVRMKERISLRDPDTLEIALVMQAPALFTVPFRTTFVYRRDPGHHFHPQSDCVEDDRSIDPVSGKERFDLTPPANLPPPPPG
jgi:hypothetical protein